MVKLLDLVGHQTILLEMEEKELPEEFAVSERGLEYLNARLEALNKKAAKYQVPPLTLTIVNEEMIKVLKPEIKAQVKSGGLQFDKGVLTGPGSDAFWTMEKKYTVKVEGEPPHIDGYEFVARLEHTSEGNFIYTNPKSSVPNLPAEFKSLNQRCDICQTNRDRNDTFVIRMEKEDLKRFPDKKAGDLLVVGRNCLARFMPGISIAGLISYTKMIDNLQDDIAAASEMENDDSGGGGGGGKYYEHPETLLKFLVAAYLHTGFYMSKKQANANAEMGNEGNSQSTLSRALSEMRPYGSKDPKKAFPIYYRLLEDSSFIDSVDKMMAEFDAWLKTKDFDAMAAAKPDFADFFHNLKLVASQEYLKGNHFGFFAALFQLFLRDKNDAEKQVASLPPSPVKFDATLEKKRLRDIAKETEVKRLAAGGMDEKAIKKVIRGKEWGWEVTAKKITEYEKTQTFGYGDAGVGYRISFRDDYGNDFLWFASTADGFQEGGKYIIDGTVVGYEPTNKYTNRPQTRINRVRILKDLQNPTAPPQAEPPVTGTSPA
jgi:hypothetical protein